MRPLNQRCAGAGGSGQGQRGERGAEGGRGGRAQGAPARSSTLPLSPRRATLSRCPLLAALAPSIAWRWSRLRVERRRTHRGASPCPGRAPRAARRPRAALRSARRRSRCVRSGARRTPSPPRDLEAGARSAGGVAARQQVRGGHEHQGGARRGEVHVHGVRSRSPLLARRSPLLARRSPLLAGRSPLLAGRSPLLAGRSPLLARRSPLLARRSPLLARRSPAAPCRCPRPLSR